MATARFCSDACRKRQHYRLTSRRRPVSPVSSPSAVGSSVRAELDACGTLGTVDGAAAVALADQIDRGEDTAAAMVAMGRELRAALRAATTTESASRGGGDLVDELHARRQRRRREDP
jgi:hypothetical protein